MTKKTFVHFTENNNNMPLIAILRGITPEEAIDVADALVESGFTIMEITLNSPKAYESIKLISDRHGDNISLGAGTVLNPHQVKTVKDAGGDLIISPNLNLDVVAETLRQDMVSIPGCYTPTEVFTALDAGADIVKIFPADTLGAKYIGAIKAVLPTDACICPTGGVNVDNISDFVGLGVSSMGIGSALYKPGKTLDIIKSSALDFVQAYKASRY